MPKARREPLKRFLEVGLEDRFQHKLGGSLHHSSYAVPGLTRASLAGERSVGGLLYSRADIGVDAKPARPRLLLRPSSTKRPT